MIQLKVLDNLPDKEGDAKTKEETKVLFKTKTKREKYKILDDENNLIKDHVILELKTTTRESQIEDYFKVFIFNLASIVIKYAVLLILHPGSSL